MPFLHNLSLYDGIKLEICEMIMDYCCSGASAVSAVVEVSPITIMPLQPWVQKLTDARSSKMLLMARRRFLAILLNHFHEDTRARTIIAITALLFFHSSCHLPRRHVATPPPHRSGFSLRCRSIAPVLVFSAHSSLYGQQMIASFSPQKSGQKNVTLDGSQRLCIFRFR